jgi:hypothetical protein
MTTPLLTPTIPPTVPPTVPQYPYGLNPYGMMPMMPGGGGGGGGGGDFPDGGGDESDGFDDVDLNDGSYAEEPPLPDEAFPDEPIQYDVGEYPEEIAQSQQEEDEPPDDDGSPDGPFPGEGTVARG